MLKTKLQNLILQVFPTFFRLDYEKFNLDAELLDASVKGRLTDVI